jgi:hypothetical protein
MLRNKAKNLRYVDKGEAHFEIGLSCLQEKEM